ncbi:uncharacterized protein LOC122645412 [Telopea speciosissima]|uniref:uncharacterized protein LOC122645412 n=1 Tax=Telopea speciosissima TaxID=54955 RepID=UPI001CC3B53A|nr:uncharacterized protein LOC122645412 [Telopea speciosissima]
MKSISLLHRPLLLPQRPSSLILRRWRLRQWKTSLEQPCKQQSPMKVFVARKDGYDRDFDGRRVDENMIVLRMRIQDMKIKADQRKDEPPLHWMEWEKRYYHDYDSDIFEAIGLLQTQLMKTRPSLVFGMVALLALTVPTSMLITAYHLMQILKGIICGIHLN